MDELYGIDIETAHERAKTLIPEDFFWSCADELSPFGSDEGDCALAEWRDWRKSNPTTPSIECLKWTIESVGEMLWNQYNTALLDKELLFNQIADGNFDDNQYIYTLDISVIATGFGQLVDEGMIDPANKPLIQLAIDRQILWSQLQPGWQHAGDYINHMNILTRALAEA
ncbi:uncharacterized protein YfeS [Filimonas zeae]|uniref:Uncharacterized protein n=1 Tax=Filimonas zeae TaxID=1737353 RepID=A0A917J770_9BACT|nr:hypothetical protein [Filimonas zeae]MDR6342920.1 uncharacterized protein YfeS [Filimonas zeae]GGH83236.1 hypothetical protein GCM10011379_58320 [Filimonas zeae]